MITFIVETRGQDVLCRLRNLLTRNLLEYSSEVIDQEKNKREVKNTVINQKVGDLKGG